MFENLTFGTLPNLSLRNVSLTDFFSCVRHLEKKSKIFKDKLVF